MISKRGRGSCKKQLGRLPHTSCLFVILYYQATARPWLTIYHIFSPVRASTLLLRGEVAGILAEELPIPVDH